MTYFSLKYSLEVLHLHYQMVTLSGFEQRSAFP